MKFPEIELSTVLKQQNPFCIAFVYPKNGKNCIVKGSSGEVQTYVRENYPYSYVNYTFWKDGQSRNLWSAPTGLGLYISQHRIDEPLPGDWTYTELPKGRKRYFITMVTKDGLKQNVASFRTMPKRWIPLFDQAIHNSSGKPVPLAVS